MQLTRASQRRYGDAVRQSQAEGTRVALEGPTGLGKTWGYLVPSLAATGQVIVATNTRAHVDQIVRDLERHVRPDKWAVLKGGSVYACIDKARLSALQALTRPELYAELMGYIHSHPYGDIAMSYPRWADLSPEVQALLRHDHEDCDETSTGRVCRYREAKAKAQAAQVIVTTHANILIRARYGKWDVYESAKHLVIDEAHLLEDAALQAMSTHMPAKNADGRPIRMPTPRKEQEHQTAYDHLGHTLAAARSGYETLAEDLRADLYQAGVKTDDDIMCAAAAKKASDVRTMARNYEKAIRAENNLDEGHETWRASAPTVRGAPWPCTIFLGLRIPHDQFLEEDDGKIVLHPTDVSGGLGRLYDRFRSVTLTSATLTGCSLPVQTFGTPYKPEQTTSLPARDVPRRPTGITGTDRDIAEKARYQVIAAKLLSHPAECKQVLVTSKRNAHLLADLLPSAYLEGRDPEINTRLTTDGGVGIYYQWYGHDVPHKDKLLVIDRWPTTPPNRRYAALRACKGGEVAGIQQGQQELSKIRQGLGRGIRSETDHCVMVLLETPLEAVAARNAVTYEA